MIICILFLECFSNLYSKRAAKTLCYSLFTKDLLQAEGRSCLQTTFPGFSFGKVWIPKARSYSWETRCMRAFKKEVAAVDLCDRRQMEGPGFQRHWNTWLNYL
jgi:hypothetical protein